MSGGVKMSIADQLENHRWLNQAQKHDCRYLRWHRWPDVSLALTSADDSGNLAQISMEGLLHQFPPPSVSSEDLLREKNPGYARILIGEINMALHQQMKLFQRIRSLLADGGRILPKKRCDQFQQGFQHRILAWEIPINGRWRNARLAGQSADVQIIKPVLRNDSQCRLGNLFLTSALFNFERLSAPAFV